MDEKVCSAICVWSYGGRNIVVAFVRAGTFLRSALAAAISFHAASELHERSQRNGLLPGRISPFLSVQPGGKRLGTHALGPRREPRHGALAELAHCTARRAWKIYGFLG